MNKLLITLLSLFTLSSAFSQEILVKNLQGQDVDITKVLHQSEKDQPTILITWANSYCGVCKTIIDELQEQYAPLKEKYNLRVITLNTDTNKDDRFKKYYDTMYKNEMGAYTSITDFVRNYPDIKDWEFEKYVDEYFNFFKAAGLKGAPVIYIFYNNEAKYFKYGFWIPEEAKSSDGSTKLQLTTGENTVQKIISIIESMYANEAYFNANWHYTLKDENPSYKRSILKMGNLYEITDSWITGEMQMRGTFQDHMAENYEGKATWYFKNGNKEFEKHYLNNKLEGAYTTYYENGNLYWNGSFKDSNYDGKWEGFYENGKPMAEKIWNNGKLLNINYFIDTNGETLLQNGTGVYKEYEKDVLIRIETYLELQKHGEWKYFTETGKLTNIVNYENDKPHGVFKKYHDNGKLKIEGNYSEGKKDSVWYFYDEQGKETRSELWEHGLEVKPEN